MVGLGRTSITLGALVLWAGVARGAPPGSAAGSGEPTEAALLASASTAFPARGLDDLGRPGRGFDAARAALEKLLREYPDSERAPAAEFRLGLLQMDPANPRADLDAARATFDRLVRRAPRSSVAPAALEAAALCRHLKGDSSAAAAVDVRLVAEHPSDPAAVRARIRLARESARRGDAGAHLLLPREDETEATDRARALADLLERAEEEDADEDAEGAERGELDDEFEAPTAREPVSVAATNSGAILVLDGDSGRIVIAGEGVKPPAAANPAPDAPRRRGVAVDPLGNTWIWDEKGVTPPDGARVEPRGAGKGEEPAPPVRKIVAVAPGLMGTVDVIDGSGEQVLRYGPGFVLRGTVPLPARPIAAARAEDGTLDVLLASRPRQVLEIHAGAPSAAGWPAGGGGEPARGWTTSTIVLEGDGWELDSPVAIARDDLGRIYVLDESARTVTVFDPDGRRVATYATPKGSATELRSPSSLAVDGSGRIYVADRKLGRVVRFR
jgi:hypothetical protein